jgi:hypothetical protein
LFVHTGSNTLGNSASDIFTTTERNSNNHQFTVPNSINISNQLPECNKQSIKYSIAHFDAVSVIFPKLEHREHSHHVSPSKFVPNQLPVSDNGGDSFNFTNRFLFTSDYRNTFDIATCNCSVFTN